MVHGCYRTSVTFAKSWGLPLGFALPLPIPPLAPPRPSLLSSVPAFDRDSARRSKLRPNPPSRNSHSNLDPDPPTSTSPRDTVELDQPHPQQPSPVSILDPAASAQHKNFYGAHSRISNEPSLRVCCASIPIRRHHIPAAPLAIVWRHRRASLSALCATARSTQVCSAAAVATTASPDRKRHV